MTATWLNRALRVGQGLLTAALSLLFIPAADAQTYIAPYVTLQGQVAGASGIAAKNATLTFTPSQLFFVAGTTTVVDSGQCSTDGTGLVVGIGNPLAAPRATPQFTGTLPAGSYYIVFTWRDQFGDETLASPEATVQLTAAGELNILPPAGSGPPMASGMNVYIGQSSGSETLQGQTGSTTGGFIQAVPLAAGSALPSRNATPCEIVANDAGWPTGTGYNVSMVDQSGNTLFSYPELWQFYGPGSTYNLSQGIPYYHGQVTYPIPILTVPYNHNIQSISGPLSMGLPGSGGYQIQNVAALGVGTGLPAWGIDVEGANLLGAINAKTGYLINGIGGTAGQCLGSDGTYFDTVMNCDLGRNTTPTLTVSTGGGAGAGATGFIATGSTDKGGSVTINTGTGPAAGAQMFALSFSVAYSQAFCAVFATGGNVANSTTVTGNSGPLGIVLNSGPAAALTASTTYRWNYTCSLTQ